MRWMLILSPSTPSRVRPLWAAAVVAAMCVGCGSEVYQKRLQETVAYFEYKDRLNRELGRPWSDEGIAFQPPAQFSLMAAPTGQDTENGDRVFFDPSEDPRQPHYLGIELPGLVAAWEADVDTDSEESPGTQKAYLYVLSNHERYRQQESGEGEAHDPQTLISDVENTLTAAVGVYLPQGMSSSGRDKNTRHREVVPGGLPNIKYRSQQEFTAATLSPAVQPIDMPIEMQLYEWEGKKIQVVILMIYPEAVSPQEDLQNRLLLALETFEASDQPPKTSKSSAPASGGRRSPAF